MKPLLASIGLLSSVIGVVLSAPAKKKPVGRCDPYAEVCRFCTDCTQCGHCAGKGGKCSVCFKK